MLYSNANRETAIAVGKLNPVLSLEREKCNDYRKTYSVGIK